MKHFEDLVFWIREREEIRVQKELGLPRPWTTDPILDQYRFCNVYREDDVVTKWIHENWMMPHRDEDSVAFAIVVARMVNRPETLADMGYPERWSSTHFIKTIMDRKARKLKVWTQAYMITGGYSEGGETKEVIIARVLDGAYLKLQKNPIKKTDTLEQACEKIKSPGIGTFLSAQVIADLKFSPLLMDASDWDTWCAIGPGSTAGLNYLHERPPTKTLTEKQFREEVNVVRDKLAEEAGIHLCAQNTQNCLCEFSKYVRTKYYGGRPKALYVPAAPTPLAR